MHKTIRNLLATAPIMRKCHYHELSEIKLMQQNKYDIEDEASGWLNHTKIQSIYLDLDGVLVDHHGYLAMMEGVSKEVFINRLKELKALGKKEEYIYPLILSSIEQESFIYAKPTNEFKEFLRLIEHWLNLNINVEILSSVMKPHGLNDEIKRQKLIWIDNHNLTHLPINFTNGSAYKKSYAEDNALLIDDFDRNINDWLSTDFKTYGILHTDMLTTIKELKKLGLY